MQVKYAVTVVLLWVLATGGAGIAVNVSSVPSWILLFALASVPPLMMTWWLSDDPQTLSHRIQEAKR